MTSKERVLRALNYKEANKVPIDILVSLPSFGDERAIADAIKMSGLSVPGF